MVGFDDMVDVSSFVVFSCGVIWLSICVSVCRYYGMLVVVIVGFDRMRLCSWCGSRSADFNAMLLFIEWLSRNTGILGCVCVVMVNIWFRLSSRKS